MNANVVNDRELLGRYVAGDSSAMSQLIERHSRRVRDYIRMLVKDHDLVEDIFQETFIKVVRVIDHFRSTKQDRSLSEHEAGYDVLGSLQLGDATVEDRMVAEQTGREIRALIEELPDEQREVVKMRYYGNLSFREIAEETGVSINTALGRMRYALINLRRLIQEKKMILC